MRLLILCLCLCFVAGCGDGGPSRVPVSGMVKVNGEPLAKGSIVFTPTAGTTGPRSAGVIENGAYRIPEGDGPMIGKLRVEIRADQDLGFQLDDPEEFKKHADPGGALPPNPIPPTYNDESTLIRETVADGENTFDFEIDAKSDESSDEQ